MRRRVSACRSRLWTISVGTCPRFWRWRLPKVIFLGTLMKELGVDGKLVADQLGHSLDVSQNVYTSTSVESRLAGLNQLEKSLAVN